MGRLEIGSLGRLLQRADEVDKAVIKKELTRLAYDGSGAALEALKQARTTMPVALRGDLARALDLCRFFNFNKEFEAVQPTQEEVAALLQLADAKRFKQLREHYRIKKALEDKGVLVDLGRGIPLAVKLAYVRRLRDAIGARRYEGRCSALLTGCTGSCGSCFQERWCTVAHRV